jgi:hypothetical protein
MDKALVLLNSPVMILILAVLFLLAFLRGSKLDFPSFIVAINSISTQPFALSVLVIGFWMLVECKKFGIDTTIAGGVIGVASNMLQSQLKDATHPPPGAAVRSDLHTEYQTGTKDVNSNPKQ